MLKVAIIGSGFGLYGLLPAFNSIDHYKVVGFCGKKTKRVKTYCSYIGIKTIYTDWKKMITETKPDVLAIATSPSQQYEIAKFAIKHKIHIFAEKPLTNELKTAKKLVALADKHKIKGSVDFIFPEIPEWLKCKAIINSTKLGALEKIDVTWKFYSYDLKNKIRGWKTDKKQGGGALMFYCSHVLYNLGWFLGDLKIKSANSITSKESLNKGETGLNFTFKSKKVKGTVQFNCAEKKSNEHSMDFVCERGLLRLTNKKSTTSDFTLYTGPSIKKLKKISVKKISSVKGEDERVKEVKSIANRLALSIKKNTSMQPAFKDGLWVQKKIFSIQKLIA